MDIFANIMIGLDTAISPVNLLYCFIGVFLGTFFRCFAGHWVIGGNIDGLASDFLS